MSEEELNVKVEKQLIKDFNDDLKRKIDPLHSLVNNGFCYDKIEKDLRELFIAVGLIYFNKGYQKAKEEDDKKFKEFIRLLKDKCELTIFQERELNKIAGSDLIEEKKDE